MTFPKVRTFVLSAALLWCGLVFAEGPVNINTADAEALAAALSGVGEARAAAIVEYRDGNGPFASADELSNVPGIGASTVENNRDRILVD
ncbi:MAG: helix-hairpin-helix domain-containing protein [Ectothiorhodospiraceae bacterium]|nr:helix-hairpin-helix domain-containing protein [Ectothiorhodospiraceae bacterium]MCH8505244.1 helix-hairpin-helix domain-containing protein [Ectothiorhodospiraceae bacterium]